jgi:hypothetical protein
MASSTAAAARTVISLTMACILSMGCWNVGTCTWAQGTRLAEADLQPSCMRTGCMGRLHSKGTAPCTHCGVQPLLHLCPHAAEVQRPAQKKHCMPLMPLANSGMALICPSGSCGPCCLWQQFSHAHLTLVRQCWNARTSLKCLKNLRSERGGIKCAKESRRKGARQRAAQRSSHAWPIQVCS